MKARFVLLLATMAITLVGCHPTVVPPGEAYQKRMDEPSGPPISGNPSIEVDPCSGSTKCGSK